MLRETFPSHANELPGRFVMSIKSTMDGTTKCKARFVVSGHRDQFKKIMVHSS